MKTVPSNRDDVIDSRDVIARIRELEADEERDEDDAEELESLLALQGEAEDYAPDWTYGAQLIRESYFETYAQELADELGAIPKGSSWPLTCIDWEEAARQLAEDYTEVDFDGVTYYVR